MSPVMSRAKLTCPKPRYVELLRSERERKQHHSAAISATEATSLAAVEDSGQVLFTLRHFDSNDEPVLRAVWALRPLNEPFFLCRLLTRASALLCSSRP